MAAEFRQWLAANHASQTELWVGFYKKDSGRPTITYSESVDQAICFGWIDGVRVSIDGASHKIRFTPRKPRSIWSAINIRKANELTRLGLMHQAGDKAFNARTDDRSEIYAFERKAKRELDPVFAKQLAANKKAKAFFDAQRPSYQRVVIHWVMSAKKDETKLKRLQQLISDSEKGLWVPQLRRAQPARKP
jgi:uncharacterized protein YdeI (YjbR/CyaY-like superfamily)